MKKFIKKNKKLVSIVGAIALIIIVFILVYKIFFSSNSSNRYEGIKSHQLSKTEISDVKKIVNELDKVESVKVYTNSKIIKIVVNLKENVELDQVKDIANRTISKIDKNNLKFYDMEFFVQTKSDSDIYPKIGYKHKSSDSFVW